jgi:hypothetical protein
VMARLIRRSRRRPSAASRESRTLPRDAGLIDRRDGDGERRVAGIEDISARAKR